MKLLYICLRFCTFQYRFSQPQIVALLQLPVLFQPVYTGSPPPVYNPPPPPPHRTIYGTLWYVPFQIIFFTDFPDHHESGLGE